MWFGKFEERRNLKADSYDNTCLSFLCSEWYIWLYLSFYFCITILSHILSYGAGFCCFKVFVNSEVTARCSLFKMKSLSKIEFDLFYNRTNIFFSPQVWIKSFAVAVPGITIGFAKASLP